MNDKILSWKTARPKIRGDCLRRPRPCPWIGCKYHLIHLTRASRRIYNETSATLIIKYITEMKQTCTLDLAERGDVTLEEIGEAVGLTRERIRQIQDKAINKAKHVSRRGYLKDFIGEGPLKGPDI